MSAPCLVCQANWKTECVHVKDAVRAGESDGWRRGVEASIRKLEVMLNKPRDLWHEVYFIAVEEAIVKLKAMLERGTERAGSEIV